MDYVSGGLGGTLGFIAGDVPGAVVGYKLGKKAYKFFNSKKSNNSNMKRKSLMITPPRTPKVRVKTKTLKVVKPAKKLFKRRIVKKKVKKIVKAKRDPFGGISTSQYAGKFSLPGKIVKDAETICSKLGYHITNEQYGEVADPNCVYLYHSNYCIDDIASVIQSALLRTLFRKAGIEIGNELQEIPFSYSDNSYGFRIIYTKRDKITGVLGTSFYDGVNNITFKDVTLGMYSVMGSHFRDYMENVNSDQEPYMLGLYANDESTFSTQFRCLANLTLQDEFVVLNTTSSLIVQNRTIGSTSSTDYSADRVDNQPLVGYLYQFKNGDPRLRVNQITNIGVANAHEIYYASGDRRGVRSFGGTQLGNDMQEPPVPKLWRNIQYASKVNLDPGFIKKSYVHSVFKNRLPELLKRLKVDKMQISDGVHSYTQLSGCKSQLIALEEGLRTQTTNLITVLFERESKIGAYTYTKKTKGLFRTRFQSESIPASVIA